MERPAGRGTSFVSTFTMPAFARPRDPVLWPSRVRARLLPMATRGSDEQAKLQVARRRAPRSSPSSRSTRASAPGLPSPRHAARRRSCRSPLNTTRRRSEPHRDQHAHPQSLAARGKAARPPEQSCLCLSVFVSGRLSVVVSGRLSVPVSGRDRQRLWLRVDPRRTVRPSEELVGLPVAHGLSLRVVPGDGASELQ